MRYMLALGRLLAGVLVVVGLMSGCDGEQPMGPPRSNGTEASPSGDVDRGVAMTRAPRVLEHSCTGDGVGPFPAEGQYPPAPDWRRQELSAGGVGFEDHAQSRDRPRSRFAGRKGRYRAYAFALIVSAGKIATIRIVRGEAAFIRDPSDDDGDDRFKLSQGARVLRLNACDEEDTRFLEGLIVGGPQCLRLRATTGVGREGVVGIPFATPCR